jgi:hypothetical protein
VLKIERAMKLDILCLTVHPFCQNSACRWPKRETLVTMSEIQP